MADVQVKNQALDILSEISDSQCRSILTQIVKLRPSVVVSAYSSIVDSVAKHDTSTDFLGNIRLAKPNVRDSIIRCAATYGKIQCIKLYRLLTNEGLKEAKDYVEMHCSTFAPVSASYYVPSIENGILVSTQYDGVLTSFIAGLASLVFETKYEQAFETFITYFHLQNDRASFFLFKRYLKALFIIE